jgi:hypothetical protein
MPSPLNAHDVLGREFLEIRAKLLEVAAALDRLDRAEGDLAGDLRIDRIQRGIACLAEEAPDRAERLQRIFSLDYDAGWRAGLQRRSG